MNKCCEKCIGLTLEHKCYGPNPDCHTDHPSNKVSQEKPEEVASAGWEDIVSRLRAPANWMSETRGQEWKSAVGKYDRTPYEAADLIEKLLTLLPEQESK